MQQFRINGQLLTKGQQQTIIGGNLAATSEVDVPCIPPGDPCNDHVQCCSAECVFDGTGPTGKTCAYF